MTTPTANAFAWSFATIAAALFLSAFVNLQLFQDGASYLLELSTSDAAIRHGRLGVYLVQGPTIAVREVLRVLGVDAFWRLQVLRLVFSLNYALVPLLALLASWLVVRNRAPHLFLWPALIILYVNLVNFSWVSELLIAMQFSCPLALICWVSPERRSAWLLAAFLGLWIASLHPLSFLLLLTIGAGCLAANRYNGTVRRSAKVLALLLMLGAAVRGVASLVIMTDYERSMVEPTSLRDYLFVTSIANVAALSCALMVGLRRLGSDASSRSFVWDASLILAGCLLLIVHFCTGVSGFPLKTGLALFTALALLIMGASDARRRVTSAEQNGRQWLGIMLAAAFAVVIVAKSGFWLAANASLERELVTTTRACTERSELADPWLQRRPGNLIDTWALPSLVLVSQIGNPARLVLADGDCAEYARSGETKIDPWTTLAPAIVRPFLERPAHP